MKQWKIHQQEQGRKSWHGLETHTYTLKLAYNKLQSYREGQHENFYNEF